MNFLLLDRVDFVTDLVLLVIALALHEKYSFENFFKLEHLFTLAIEDCIEIDVRIILRNIMIN